MEALKSDDMPEQLALDLSLDECSDLMCAIEDALRTGNYLTPVERKYAARLAQLSKRIGAYRHDKALRKFRLQDEFDSIYGKEE